MTPARRRDALLAAAGTAALVALPLATGQLRELAGMATFVVAILGLNLLTGYTGQVSLGHGAFMSVGGYTTAILVARHGFPDWTTIPLAALVAGAAGLAFGLPALRLSGFQLALATFGAAVALPVLERRLDGFTGGSLGLPLRFHTGSFDYAVAWAVAVPLLAAAAWLVRSRTGRAWRALRDSEVAAAAAGIAPARYKVLAFGVSGAYAGAAGSLFALQQQYVTPDTYPVQLSLVLLAGAAVAGFGGLAGTLVGAAFLEFVRRYAPDVAPQFPAVVFGGLLVAVMLLAPTGAAGALRRLTTRIYTRSP